MTRSRQQRRAQARQEAKAARRRVATAITTAKHRAQADGRPYRLLGFHSACADCSATADITLMPSGAATANIHHDEHCPAAAGAVPWRVVA